MSEPRLQVSELFYSLQGESTLSGLPTLFIRLQACNLDCVYCDTRHSRTPGGGRSLAVAEVLRWALDGRCRRVCITGGEPLLQRTPLIALSARLLDEGFAVSLETNGSLDVGGLPSPLKRILDLKTPGSGMAACNRWENLALLDSGDEVKFVVGNHEDFLWTLAVIRRYGLPEKLPVLVSPVQGVLPPAELARWILEEELPLRLQLQLHRLLWPGGEQGAADRRPAGGGGAGRERQGEEQAEGAADGEAVR